MALTDKNIVITPNVGSSADPKIVFSGADTSTAAQNITLKVYPTSGGMLSFEGSSGQLFSITNSMSGTIYSVNDVSGIPSIEVLDTGLVKLAQYGGTVVIGGSSSDGTSKLQVSGGPSRFGNIYVGYGTYKNSIRPVDDANLNLDTPSGYTASGTSLRAPIFYDSENTSYYLDPNGGFNFLCGGATLSSSTSGYFVSNPEGSGVSNVRLGAAWGQPGIYSSSNIYLMSENAVYWRTQNNNRGYMDNSGNLVAYGSMQAPVFYDYNNTGYYLDPTSANSLRTVGDWRSDSSSWTGEWSGKIQYHGNNWYFQAADQWIWRNSGGSNVVYGDQNGNHWAVGSSRAPIFYDNNDTGYYVDPAGGGAKIGRDLYVSGYTGGNYGNRLIVGNTGVSYSLEDGLQRPIIQIHGQYPVLSLNHTVTSNGSHGPTVQFTANGTGNQFVIGMSGNGSRLDIGTSSNSNWNPHNGIANYEGVTGFRMDTSGNVYNYVSTRSPIFYDDNDTNYYVNPNGYSNIYSLQAASYVRASGYLQSSGNVYIDGNYGCGVVGVYDSYRYQGVFAMGDAYKLAADGTSVSNLYGIAWSHPNAGGSAGYLGSHGMLILENGSFKGAWGGGSLRTPGRVDGTIFYDWDNTGYYCDPNSTSYLYGLTLAGGTYFRPYNWIQFDDNYGLYWPNTNGAHLHANTLSSYGSIAIRGTRGGWRGIHFYDGGNTPHLMFNGSSNGGIYYEATGRWGSYYNHSNNCWGFGTSNTNGSYNIYCPTGVYSGGRVDGTIFYDSNDTTYYLDPNGYSQINGNGSVNGSSGVGLAIYSVSNNGAIMAFHRAGYYAINMGLDSDNVFRIGGWSASANRLQMDMSGNLTMAGNVTAYSDIKLKENIEVITNALNKVKQIRGVTFTRNDQEDKTIRYAGVIAQEVEKVLPEVVSEDNSGVKNVAYGNMVGLLIEAIKEQQSEIDELKSLVAQLLAK